MIFWLLLSVAVATRAPGLHDEYYLQVFSASATGSDHRLPFVTRGQSLLEVDESTDGGSTGDLSTRGDDEKLCDVCVWAVRFIADQCCTPVRGRISCDAHMPSCENNVTYSTLRPLLNRWAKKSWCSSRFSFCRSKTRHEMLDRVWADLTSLGTILNRWQRLRQLKPTDVSAAFAVCQSSVSETYDCLGEVTTEQVAAGDTNLRDMGNSDVKTQNHRDEVCKAVSSPRTSDVRKNCTFTDRRCVENAAHWRTKSLCFGVDQPPDSYRPLDLDVESDEDSDSDEEEEDASSEPEDIGEFSADGDLGFPELALQWNATQNAWVAAEGDAPEHIQDCLEQVRGVRDLATYLRNGKSTEMIRDTCIFLNKIQEMDTWYMENIPKNVAKMLESAYTKGAKRWILTKMLHMEDELQNVGFGTHLVAKANKLTSKWDQKGVKAYETRDMEKKIHYIRHFVQAYQVDLNEVQGLEGCGDEEACILKAGEVFATYNHFFYRKLTMGARKFLCYSQADSECAEVDAAQRQEVTVASPADGRVVVFEDLDPYRTGMWVKGEKFLLQNIVKFSRGTDYDYYQGGTAFIVRLAPQDYHRFHFPVDGIIRSFQNYPGNYYSVNPIAVQSKDPVFSTNKRMHVSIETGEDNFGCVTFVSVGATNVGSVMHTSWVNQAVLRGMEHGYMAFGGSTVLIFIRKGVAQPVRQIRDMSEIPVETILRMGETLATRRANGERPAQESSSPCNRYTWTSWDDYLKRAG